VATVTGTSFTDPASKLSPSTGYAYSVQAYDATGNVSPPAAAPNTISPKAAGSDTTAPSSAMLAAPSDGSTVSGSVGLSAAAADNVGVTRVQFFIDGALLGQATSPFSYTWNTLTTYNGSHSVYVRAYDAAGNYSTTALAALMVSNGGGSTDTTPPSSPSNLTGVASSPTQVNLTWNASTDNSAVTGYSVYRNGSKLATVTGTSWSDSAVVAASTYSYFVTAFDAAGNVSAASNTASVTTPSAPAPPPATGSVGGVVSDSKTGALLGGVKVTVTVNGAKQTFFTDSTGHYTVPSLPPATYTLTYSLKAHKNVQVTAGVTAGQCVTVNVAM